MICSRRRALALLSSAAALGTAGCAQFDSSDDGGSSTVALEATVSGPDGERTLFDQDDVTEVGEVRQQRGSGAYAVPVELTDAGTERASEAFRRVGGAESPEDTSITMTMDGEEKGVFDVTPALAEEIASDDWDGEIHVLLEDEAEAETLREGLSDT